MPEEYDKNMKDKVNFYFAVLIVTIIGVFATQIIIHVVYANSFDITIGGSGENYIPLKKSILSQ